MGWSLYPIHTPVGGVSDTDRTGDVFMGIEANEKRAGHLKVGDEAPSPTLHILHEKRGRQRTLLFLYVAAAPGRVLSTAFTKGWLPDQ